MYKVSSRFLPRIAHNKYTLHPDEMGSYGELLQGVCMATDAGQFTSLSESMNPMTLSALMNKYYSVIFPAVTTHNGQISDVMGDAMIALWAKPVADTQLRLDACHAAIEINTAIRQFNQLPPHQLPTRQGLHFGEMRLSNADAVGHPEYRAGGDIISTATRIVGLNKVLGTQILVSDTVMAGLSGFVGRDLGFFLLKGKTQPIGIFELVSKGSQAEPKVAPLLHAFSKALQLFQTYQWAKAQKAFVNINKYYPNDGPTIFYMLYLQKCQPHPQGQGSLLFKPVVEVNDGLDSW